MTDSRDHTSINTISALGNCLEKDHTGEYLHRSICMCLGVNQLSFIQRFIAGSGGYLNEIIEDECRCTTKKTDTT